MRTRLTVGDKVKQKSTGGIGIITDVTGVGLDNYAIYGEGLSYTAWYSSDELELLELATDALIEEAVRLVNEERRFEEGDIDEEDED